MAADDPHENLGDHQLPKVTGNGAHATVSLLDYLEAVRAGDIALQQERDRRYAEVGAEREKALKIKEKADEVALGLAREIQTYKDTKANELREQISSERGLYATKEDITALREYFDVLHRPVVEFMARYQGKSQGGADSRLSIGLIAQVISTFAVLATLLLLHGK